MRFDADRVIEMYQRKGGNVSATCSALNISRAQFYRWKSKNKKFAEALDDAYEAIIDNVESKLLSKINDGDTTSIIFFLKTKAKHRGYVEKTEVDNRLEVVEPVQLFLPDNGRGE